MRRCCWCCCGITPARAGKSGPKAGCRCCSWNYPRSRGEKQILAAGSVAWRELPPLARGKDWYEQNGIEINRITPARAGKRKARKPNVRECAELPPLARGKARAAAQPLRGSGITPARAGKSINFLSIQGIYQNYPRSRGEKSTTIFSPACTRELPPLARGKAQRSTLVQVGDRITPARAGKRRHSSLHLCHGRNYPRSRGEKGLALRPGMSTPELPPLARGKA